jgi:hypothetical protein
MTYEELFGHIYSASQGIKERAEGLDPSTRKAWSVLNNLLGRGGFDHWFENLDADIQDEIFQELKQTITDA